MDKIASFTVDHTKFGAGLYISRTDGDITTYDMRTRTPNAGDYMDNLTMHSFEHMFATYIRNSDLDIIYFGPMGCQTGFYLLVRNADNSKVLAKIRKTLLDIISHTGEMFGCSAEECGNYRNLSTDAAITEAKKYLEILDNTRLDFKYY